MSTKSSKSSKSSSRSKASDKPELKVKWEEGDRDDSPIVQIASIVAAGAISILVFRQLQKTFQQQPFAEAAFDLAKEVAAKSLMIHKQIREDEE